MSAPVIGVTLLEELSRVRSKSNALAYWKDVENRFSKSRRMCDVSLVTTLTERFLWRASARLLSNMAGAVGGAFINYGIAWVLWLPAIVLPFIACLLASLEVVIGLILWLASRLRACSLLALFISAYAWGERALFTSLESNLRYLSVIWLVSRGLLLFETTLLRRLVLGEAARTESL